MGGRPGTTGGPRAGPGGRGPRGPFSPRLLQPPLTQGSSRLCGLGHRRHQKDVQMPPFAWQTNFFVTFSSRPDLALLRMNQPAPRRKRARTYPLCARPPARVSCGLAVGRRRGRALPGQGWEAGAAQPAWPPPQGRLSGAEPPLGAPFVWPGVICHPRARTTPPAYFSPPLPGSQLFPSKWGPVCRLWRRANQGLPNACAELKWRRVGASH